MKTRNNITTMTAVALAFAAGTGLALLLDRPAGTMERVFLPVNGSKIDAVIGMIARSYVDSVDTRALEEIAIPALLQELDPHTVYLPARETQRARETITGNFGGIGIQFYKYRDTVVVIKVIPGGPSEEAGIRDGDRIVQVDDSIVAGRGLSSDHIMGMMRGETGTGVSLRVHRAGIPPLTRQITRGSIPIKSVDVAFMVDDTCGYCKVSMFDLNTHAEFSRALARLKAGGARKLIVDLRGNEGGVLPVALQMVNEFLPADRLMLYTLGQASPRKEYRST